MTKTYLLRGADLTVPQRETVDYARCWNPLTMVCLEEEDGCDKLCISTVDASWIKHLRVAEMLPREPTERMVKAADKRLLELGVVASDSSLCVLWRTMYEEWERRDG